MLKKIFWSKAPEQLVNPHCGEDCGSEMTHLQLHTPLIRTAILSRIVTKLPSSCLLIQRYLMPPPVQIVKTLCVVNAALLLLFSSTTGIIKNGGEKPNIIPAYTELDFYMRTPMVLDLCDLKAKAEACFKAAAVATGCRVSSSKKSSTGPTFRLCTWLDLAVT